MRVYELYFADYETYNPYLFICCEPISFEQWKEKCDSLYCRAIDMVLSKCGGGMRHVGLHQIVEELVELLKNDGFVLLSPIRYGYNGSTIITEKEDFGLDCNNRIPDEYLNKVLEFNKFIFDKVRANVIK